MIGWSGDAIQLQADNPDIQFVMPTEGCMIWSDNMVIPVGAPNPTAAYAWMNYVYEPKNQAQITNYNYYFSPVAGVQAAAREAGSGGREEPADLPDRSSTRRTARPRSILRASDEDVSEVEQAFQAVITG